MDTRPNREGPEDWHLTGDIKIEHGKGDPFAAAIRATRMAMAITDPRRPDNPIIFVNEAFLKLTGYEREEVEGRNCRFLQGPDTDSAAAGTIRDAVAAGRDVNIDILNYRKDGTQFWNALYISPVYNETGELQFFFSSQIDVTDRMDAVERVQAEKARIEQAVHDRTLELQQALEAQTALLHEVDHRVKNNLQMVSSLIVMQARTIPDENIQRSLRAMLERVEALSTVHRRLYQSDDVSRFDVSEFARDLATDLVGASGRDISLDFRLSPVEVAAEKAAPIALIVNELITNAIKHAFAGHDGAKLTVSVSGADGVCTVEVADNGKGIAGEPRAGSFGMKLMRSIGRQLDANIEWTDAAPGTRARITMPITPARRSKET